MAASTISADAQAYLGTYDQATKDYAMANAPGNVLTSGEARRLVGAYSATQAPAPVAPIAQAPAPVAQAPYTPPQFNFDPNQYLPGIQQTASSIYDPQKAQIDALKAISQQQTDQTKIVTNEQFDKELQARIEAINARGAFFGGGAIDQQNQIGTERTRSLTGIDLQNQASQAGFLAQQAGLNAAQTQYVQDQLNNTNAGAYGRWKDQQSFIIDEKNSQTQKDQFNQNLQHQKDVEIIQQKQWDLNFQQQKAESERNYQLQLKQLKASLKQNSKQYKLEKARLDQVKSAQDDDLAYKYAALKKTVSSGGGSSNGGPF